jgi:hypothetical protein
MYLREDIINDFIGRTVSYAWDIGDIIDGDEIFEPGFTLDKKWGFNIENKTVFNGVENFKQLIGLKLKDYKQEDNKFIKFIFEKDRFIEVDMSDSGFEGPEAILIYKNGKLNFVIRDADDIPEWEV